MVKKTKKTTDWELESPLDEGATLDDLINSPPFKEASDERGESTTAGTRIPSWLHRSVVKLREMEGSPYELNSDVIRDGLYIGLRILHMRYSLSTKWNVETKLADIVSSSGALKRLKSHFKELEANLDEMYREGDEQRAIDRLSDYVTTASGIGDPWYRVMLMGMIKASKIIDNVLSKCPKEIQNIVKGEE